MRICEIWGITPERIREYLREEEKLSMTEPDRYSDGCVTICLKALPPRVLGSVAFPQTQVTFEGVDRETETLHRRFVLRFISAGG